MYHSYPEQPRLGACSGSRPDHRKAAPVDTQVNRYYFYYHYVSCLPWAVQILCLQRDETWQWWSHSDRRRGSAHFPSGVDSLARERWRAGTGRGSWWTPAPLGRKCAPRNKKSGLYFFIGPISWLQTVPALENNKGKCQNSPVRAAEGCSSAVMIHHWSVIPHLPLVTNFSSKLVTASLKFWRLP